MQENDPDILVDLTHETTPFAAEITRQSLQAAGIPAFAATTVGMWLQWDIASAQPIRIQVRRRDLAAAREELARQRAESSSIDWDTEDVGVPEAGEEAASRPSDPNWAEHRQERRTVAQTMIWLACIPAYGLFAIFAFAVGGSIKLIRAATRA
jgi:hypothetical protein